MCGRGRHGVIGGQPARRRAAAAAGTPWWENGTPFQRFAVARADWRGGRGRTHPRADQTARFRGEAATREAPARRGRPVGGASAPPRDRDRAGSVLGPAAAAPRVAGDRWRSEPSPRTASRRGRGLPELTAWATTPSWSAVVTTGWW